MARQTETDAASADRDDQLGEALETYLEMAEAGDAPDPETFAAGYPDLRDDLLSALEGLALVQGLVGEPSGLGQVGRLETGHRIAGYRIVRELGRGGMGVVYEAVHVALDRPVALKVLGTHATPDSAGRRRFLNEAKTAAGLHHTHIVPVFDVGQVGALCYYAMQRIEGSGLDRVIRFLRRERPTAAGSTGGSGYGHATPLSLWGRAGAAITPFSRWSRGAAAATTIPPHDPGAESETGVWHPAPFTGSAAPAADLLAPPVRQRARRDDEPSPFEPPRGASYYRWVAEVGREAAEALGHAHRRGIIHRDVKPSNLLVDGRGLVWVADFGLARRISDPGLSQSDALIGTPRYMSPEQARSTPVDGRSDLFSLGATLYELLTLRPPFEGKSTAELTDQITHRDPPSLRSVDPRVPRDLETIVLKLLAKRPADRYATAGALAEDLVRFLHHEPVLARRISPLGRLWRFAQRHPGGTAITSTAAAAVIGVTTLAYLRVVQERDQTIRALDVAKDQRDEAERARRQAHEAMTATKAALRNQYWREASLVRLSNRPDRLTEGLGLIKESAALEPEPALRAKLRQETVEFLMLREVSARQGFPTGRTRAVAFTQDGDRLAALIDSGPGGTFGLWDAATREKLAERPLRQGRSEVGRGGGGGGGGGPRRGSGFGFGFGFGFGSPMAAAGPRMAVVAPDGQGVRLFDAKTGARLNDLGMPGRRVVGLYASTDGRRLVTLEIALLPRPIDPAEASPDSPGNAEAPEKSGTPATAAPSPRGGEGRSPGPWGPSNRFEVNLWDPAIQDHPIASLGTWIPDAAGFSIPLVAISPDGRYVATARARGTTVDLWAGEDGAPWTGEDGDILPPIDTQVELSALALGPDNQLATAGSGEVRLWDLATRAPLATITPNQSGVRLLRYSPNGSLLAVVGWLGRDVELWDPAAHAVVAVLPTADPVEDLTFSPDGLTLVASDRGANAPVWSLIEPAARSRIGGLDALTRSMAFRADGLLAVGTYKGTIRFWQAGRSLQSGAPQEVEGAGTNAHANANPPATAAATDRTPATPEAEPASLAFDDHGRLVTLEQNAFRVWNNPPRCSAGEIIPREGSSGPSRFGSVILAASHGGRFIALTQPSPQPPPPPRGGTPSEKGAAGPPPNRGGRPPEFGRGGQVLLWKSDEPGRLAMVTPPTPEPGDGERGRFGPRSAWRSLAVAPDGDRLYLIDLERNLHVWDLDGEAAVNVRWPDPPRDLSTLALSPDGTRLAAGGRSGVVTLFDTASGEPLEEFDPESDETDGGVWSLAFSPDGGLLAVGTQQGPVVLWSLDDTTLPKVRLPGQRGNVAALAFDPQGRYLATAGSDRVVDVWDLGTLRDEFNRLGLGW